MKTHLKLIAGVALAAISSASAQENTTKPVGFRTETIKAGVFNLISAELTEAVSAAGTATGVSATGLTDDAADFTTTLAGTETWVVQITSGAANGTVIEATAAGTTLTSPDFAAAGVAAGDSYEVRASKTLADIFGPANEAGLTAGTADTADIIWVPNGDGTFTRYYQKLGGLGGNGWRSLASPTKDESGAPIVYSDAFFIQSRSATDKNLVIVGHVQTRAATVGLIQGFNFVSRIAPVGQTLATTGLLPTLLGGAAANADLVWIPDGAGGYTRYYSKIGGLGGDGWRSLSAPAADASGTPLASGVIIQRKGAATNAKVGVPAFYANL